MPQTCRIGRGDRRVPTDRLRTKHRATSQWSDRGSDQLQPPDLVVRRAKRSTPTRQTLLDGRRNQLRPPNGCPAEEGLITPTAGRVQGEKGFTLQPSGLGRGRRAKSLQPSARAACGGLYHSALAASLVGDLFGASRAEGTTPRFLGRETLEKPDNASIISASATARQGLGSPLAEINHLSSQKFTGSRRNPASLISPRDRT